MIGSTRQHQSSADPARTPYASPQPLRQAAVRDAAVPVQPLVPFVPREFREKMRDVSASATVMADSRPQAIAADSQAEALGSSLAVYPAGMADAEYNAEYSNDEIARDFAGIGEDEIAEPEVSQGAAHPDPALTDAEVSQEAAQDSDLPWIDAFAVDGEEAEETWPMGEAGRRLDELTESLSSLDASRSRRNQNSGAHAAQEVPADVSSGAAPIEANAQGTPALPMWNEEEWIDIMPTSMHGPSMRDTTANDTAANDATVIDTTAEASANSASEVSLFYRDVSPPNPGAEITAKALESLAQRIRAGELPVPEVQTEVAEEAVLAGVLASMLGWRQ